jgi:ubiquinone/menaquinone biosynthesis C-methylase UbiE
MQQGKRDFDAVAAKWDKEPRRVALAHDVAAAIIKIARVGNNTKMLDFGCGTGLVTLALQPYVEAVVAADSSKGMLAQLEQKLADAGISKVTTCFVEHNDLCRLDSDFDLVVSSMTMHHVENVAALVEKFHRLLKPGGMLCIADLDKEDGTFHDDPTGIAHNGFEKTEMESYFNAAGFKAISTIRAATVVKSGQSKVREYHVNLTVGTA